MSIKAIVCPPETATCSIPLNENARLAALQSYEILDSAPEPDYEQLVELAAEICQVPIAAISLIDSDRQWFKASYGLDASETPRDLAFCAQTILRPEPLIVSDASQDPRFCRHPFVVNDPGVRFYAGVPLLDDGGHALGSLCVVDKRPRELSAFQRRALITLTRQVMQLLELRRYALLQARQLEQAERSRHCQRELNQLGYQIDWPLDQLLQRGLDILLNYTGMDGAGIQQQAAGQLRLLAYREQRFDPPRLGDQLALCFPAHKGFARLLFEQEAVLSWADMAAQEPQSLSLATEAGVRNLVGAAFRVAGKPDGIVACFDFHSGERQFGPLQYEFIAIFCTWLGFILERSQYIGHLRQLNESQNNLLAIVAHDLRNPLASVLSAKWLLDRQREKGMAPDAKLLQIIENGCHNANNLINQLLEIAELEHKSQKPLLEPRSLNDSLTTALDAFDQRARDKHLDLLREITPERLEVAMQPAKMRRVLDNLLHNALKFTPPGGRISVRLSRQGSEARLEVEDSGIGIPTELQPVLFDKFTQARRQGTGGERANGLGMHISREIVSQHGGRIEVWSEVGTGSRFSILLPLLASPFDPLR